jgi:hypothetical protein
MANQEAVNSQGLPKPRPEWAVGCGPDWRITYDGRRYRIEQRRRLGAGMTPIWEPWTMGVITFRWLWLARYTLRGLISNEQEKAAEKWNTVEYAD